MIEETYKKLVDMYAGDELPEELVGELEAKAMGDAELSHEMYTLKKTLQALHESDDVPFTEESSQRILMKMRTRGAKIEQNSPDPLHLQYHLPIQG